MVAWHNQVRIFRFHAQTNFNGVLGNDFDDGTARWDHGTLMREEAGNNPMCF
jgi:hypothetical protein